MNERIFDVPSISIQSKIYWIIQISFEMALYARIIRLLVVIITVKMHLIHCYQKINFNQIDDTKSESTPIDHIDTRSRIECTIACAQVNGCISTNFKKPHCELLDTILPSSQLTSARGWKYICKFYFILL